MKILKKNSLLKVVGFYLPAPMTLIVYLVSTVDGKPSLPESLLFIVLVYLFSVILCLVILHGIDFVVSLLDR
jgi:hypothetical protein